jgi:hypothetical protein
MDLEVEILDIYIFALFTQIKILHNVIFLTKMDLKVKILDIFIFCSVPPYESVYTVDRDTTTDTDNTTNNFFA